MSNYVLIADNSVLPQHDTPQRTLPGNKLIPVEKQNRKKCYVWIPARFVLIFWTFFGLFVVYALRANLSVAIVAMVKNQPQTVNETTSSLSCPKQEDNTSSANDFDEEGEFDWSDETQGVILGAFFYGYIITQIPGGLLAEKFGGKWLFGIGTLISSIATILTPLAARCHVSLMIVIRFIAGVGEGVTFPAYYTLFSNWIPQQERSASLAITSSGSHFGVIATMPAAAWLCEHGFSGGWPSVFYVFGMVGCAWFCFWAVLVFDRPESHPCITPHEQKYIVENRGSDKKSLHFKSIPWKAILTSLPVWALGITKFGNSWTYYIMMTELPNFLEKMLNFPIEKNGNLNSLMYVAIAVSGIFAGVTSDAIRARKWFSVTTLRKIYQCFATFLPGLGLCLIHFMGCNSYGVIALLIVSMAFHGLANGGEGPSSIDMTPEYIGIVFGISNCLGNISGILAPSSTGYIISSGDGGYEKWQYVFYLASGLNIFGGLAFLVFGSADPQPWPLPYEEITSEETESDISCDISDTKCIQAL